jgi:putative transposase
MSPPIRKHPAHPPPHEHQAAPTVLHVTACISPRRKLLCTPAVREALIAAWTMAQQWRVGHYTIMPDHVHLFCVPGARAPEPVRRWAGYWKRLAAQMVPELKGRWQRDVWDVQMRDLEHYTEKLSYVRMNPVRAGLTATPEDWPYPGCLHPILW